MGNTWPTTLSRPCSKTLATLALHRILEFVLEWIDIPRAGVAPSTVMNASSKPEIRTWDRSPVGRRPARENAVQPLRPRRNPCSHRRSVFADHPDRLTVLAANSNSGTSAATAHRGTIYPGRSAPIRPARSAPSCAWTKRPQACVSWGQRGRVPLGAVGIVDRDESRLAAHGQGAHPTPRDRHRPH